MVSLNYKLTYTVGLYTVGTMAGKIVVRRPPNRPVRAYHSGLTREPVSVSLRGHNHDHGRTIYVDVVVPEDEKMADHWSAAEAAIRSAYPDADIVFES